jgi:hypothetical protein
VLTHSHPRAAGAFQETLLGTTECADGSNQSTYAGHPLYHYAHEDPHQVLRHNVTGFGGRRLVVPRRIRGLSREGQPDEKMKQRIAPLRSGLSRVRAVLEHGAQAFRFASVRERMATLFAEDDVSRPSGP